MRPRPDPSGVSSGGSRVSTKASFSREAAVPLEALVPRLRRGTRVVSARRGDQPRMPSSWLSSAAIWPRSVFEREPAVEQAGDGAEQVADQFTRSGLRGDVQVHGVQVHLQSEQVEIQRSEDEVQDLA